MVVEPATSEGDSSLATRAEGALASALAAAAAPEPLKNARRLKPLLLRAESSALLIRRPFEMMGIVGPRCASNIEAERAGQRVL
jgi:hypothetical protein